MEVLTRLELIRMHHTRATFVPETFRKNVMLELRKPLVGVSKGSFCAIAQHGTVVSVVLKAVLSLFRHD